MGVKFWTGSYRDNFKHPFLLCGKNKVKSNYLVLLLPPDCLAEYEEETTIMQTSLMRVQIGEESRGEGKGEEGPPYAPSPCLIKIPYTDKMKRLQWKCFLGIQGKQFLQYWYMF